MALDFSDRAKGAGGLDFSSRASGASPPKKQTSEVLGFEKGALRPLDNLTTWMDSGSGLTADSPLAALEALRLAATSILARRLVAYRAAHPNAPSLPSVRSLVDAGNAHVAERSKTERPGLLGEVVGNIVATLPTVAITRNPLAVGAMQGALTSEHPDDAGQVAADAAMGAGLNWLGGKVVDKVVDVLKPTVSPAVATMQKYGVKLTPGQMGSKAKLVREDKLMSQPIVGPMITADREAFTDTLNRGAINRALMPIGQRLPDDIQTGHEAVAWMQQKASDAYNQVLPGLTLKADPRLAVGLRKAWNIAEALKAEDQQRFLGLIQSKARFSPDGTLSGRALPVALRDIRDLAAKFSQGDADQQILGDALAEVHQAYIDALTSQNPAAAKALKAANDAYRSSLVINKAAAAAANNGGVATPNQLALASRAVDRSKHKMATGAGRAPMQDFTKAASALSGKTPNSGTAERLMQGNVLANLKGALAAAGYQTDKALGKVATAVNGSPAAQGVRNAASGVAASPQVAPVLKRLQGLLSEYRDPATVLATQPALKGLLSGLFGDD